MEKLFKRQSIRLQGWNYASPGFYFVTIRVRCHDEKYIFGNVYNKQMCPNMYGKIVGDELLNTELIRDNVRIHDYVVMPDHVHFIMEITQSVPIGQSVGAWRAMPLRKRAFARHDERKCASARRDIHKREFSHPIANSLPTIIGAFKSATTKQINILRHMPRQPVWQRNYYEHIIRDEHDFERIRSYIAHNPGNWIDLPTSTPPFAKGGDQPPTSNI